MSNTVIRVENLSKQYRLGELGTGTLSHDLNRWWHKIRGKEDPYLKIGDVNNRSVKGDSEYVWSLRNINFDVKQGEVLGIIGKNGAGKSTLLKILSRVTAPTTGSIKAKGRIASLLEVGTGFHDELSGRDNIYLNGAILGMSKTEIRSKFEEIVAFSGTERYIDTPVKRYSSGMRVRLAFAVAAHLDPEILIVDEVLAVGDAEFQQKAVGKLQDVSLGEGRTVLFVSHNMTTMQKLCNKGLLLKNGELALHGSMQEVIDEYLVTTDLFNGKVEFAPQEQLKAYIFKVEIEDQSGNLAYEHSIGSKWKIKVFYKVNEPIKNLVAAIGITNQYELSLKTSWQLPCSVSQGLYCAEFCESETIYGVGQYKFNLGLSEGVRNIQYLEGACSMNIVPIVNNIDDSVLNFDSNTGAILNPMHMKSFRL